MEEVPLILADSFLLKLCMALSFCLNEVQALVPNE